MIASSSCASQPLTASKPTTPTALRHTSEAQELADIIQERIENAFVGTTPYLLLQDPAIMYNPDFIVRVAFELKRGEKVIEAVEQGEQRGPLGFRPR